MNVRSILPTLALLLGGCSSGFQIDDSGFKATDLGEGRWAVVFESTKVHSAEEAEMNLMYHSAKWTIDHGGVWFTFEGTGSGSETHYQTRSSSGMEPSSASPAGTVTSAGSSEPQSSIVTTSREKTFETRATIRVSREKPEGKAYEATRVVSEVHAQRGRRIESGVKVRSSPTS